MEFCQFEILPGPQKRVKWGVPDGTRNPATAELVHDDQLISAALVAVLDAQDWAFSAPTFVIQAADPLEEMDKGFKMISLRAIAEAISELIQIEQIRIGKTPLLSPFLSS